MPFSTTGKTVGKSTFLQIQIKNSVLAMLSLGCLLDVQVKMSSRWLGQQAVQSRQVEHPTQEAIKETAL